MKASKRYVGSFPPGTKGKAAHNSGDMGIILKLKGSNALFIAVLNIKKKHWYYQIILSDVETNKSCNILTNSAF